MSEIFSFDKDAVRAAFADAIRAEVTKMLVANAVISEIQSAVKKAFEKNWVTNKNSYIEQEVQLALNNALWQAVNKAVSESGISDMIQQIATEHISSDEFKESLRKRTIESIRQTTFYIKPMTEE